MIELNRDGAYLFQGDLLLGEGEALDVGIINKKLVEAGLPVLSEAEPHWGDKEKARGGSIAGRIIAKHNGAGDARSLRLRFDALASHDITYVGIIQTALASGLRKFSLPYVLTNCHNSLCAVGGTINEDDHLFGLSAARRFGGEFVPAHVAVIHQYMRVMYAGCGRMILGSDSHTRYGALGTLAVGEGGPELVKQILGKTYDMPVPDVVGIFLRGRPRPGVGPQDVALAIIGAVFSEGFVKNAVMEFVGPGVAELSVDFRIGVDVMTTETACWSSVWRTDDKIRRYLELHGRAEAYRQLDPDPVTWYDRVVTVDLDKVEPMIAMPFHPSNVYTVSELNANLYDILQKVEQDAVQLLGASIPRPLRKKVEKGCLRVDQGVIAGCSGGTFENLVAAAQILDGETIGNGAFALSVYPASQPVGVELVRNGCIEKLMLAGATIRTAFCGPCFGAGDTPANDGFSIRHTTRNFPNREGSKPREGQISFVALMDARSIAATAANGGRLTPATTMAERLHEAPYRFDRSPYDARVYRGVGHPLPDEALVYGPNIKPWPEIPPMPENRLLFVASVITDPVTTTDELIPSGETSSLRSNPLKLAEYALSRKDPLYVTRAKEAQALERERRSGEISPRLSAILEASGFGAEESALGSVIFAVKPGDGSAREQAASSQKMLGGEANVALEYATKRYRSNLVNWGMLPFVADRGAEKVFQVGDWLCIPGIRASIREGKSRVSAFLLRVREKEGFQRIDLELELPNLDPEEREILLAGCLMNRYAAR